MKKLLLFFAAVLMGLGTMAQTTYTKIYSESELNNGDKVLIVGFHEDGTAWAMSYQKTNNRKAVQVTLVGDDITTVVATEPGSTVPFEFTIGGQSGAWTFFDELTNGYLYASGGGNYLKTQGTLDDKGQWNLVADGDAFQPISNGAGVEQNNMRYNINTQNNDPLFGCYKPSSTVNGLIYIYKAGGAPVIYPEPSNYPTTFYPTIDGNGITLHWVDATGEQLPQKYLVLASPSDIMIPSDGVPVPDDNEAKNVAYGVEKVTFSDLPAGVQYTFAIFPYTNSGENINYKTNGTYPSAGATVPTVMELFYENFENGLGVFTTYNELGDEVWTQATFNNNSYAYMNGYTNGAAHANSDWLISPRIDVVEGINVEFKTATRYDGPAISVMISPDYELGMEPWEAIWFDVTDMFNYSPGNFEWTESGVVNLNQKLSEVGITEGFRMAFLYESSESTGAAAWEIDNVRVFMLVLSMEENDAVSFNLYPNPANDKICVEAANAAEVQILDMAGRMVMKVNVVEGINNINVSDLNSGVYFVKMNNTVVKFVKR